MFAASNGTAMKNANRMGDFMPLILYLRSFARSLYHEHESLRIFIPRHGERTA